MNKVKPSILIICFLLLVSCQKDVAYYSFQPIAKTGWNKADTLLFALPASLPSGKYDVNIGIRNLNNYPYRDIWLKVAYLMGDSLYYAIEKAHFYLANPSGEWIGSGTSGLYQQTIPYLKEIEINNEGGACSFRIIHDMKDQNLRGISDIGLQLIRH